MQTADALHWDMYGQGTSVGFTAMRIGSQFEVSVTRDSALLVISHAGDSTTLLKQSSALRQRLHEIEFATKP